MLGPRVLENANWIFSVDGCRDLLPGEKLPRQEKQILDIIRRSGPVTRLELVILLQSVMRTKRRPERVLSDLQSRLRSKNLITWTVPKESQNALLTPEVPKVLIENHKGERSASLTRHQLPRL